MLGGKWLCGARGICCEKSETANTNDPMVSHIIRVSIVLNNFHLDTVNFSTPSLSYYAMLLLSKVVFEPIPNLETYYFLLRAKRGGLSQVTTR